MHYQVRDASEATTDIKELRAQLEDVEVSYSKTDELLRHFEAAENFVKQPRPAGTHADVDQAYLKYLATITNEKPKAQSDLRFYESELDRLRQDLDMKIDEFSNEHSATMYRVARLANRIADNQRKHKERWKTNIVLAKEHAKWLQRISMDLRTIAWAIGGYLDKNMIEARRNLNRLPNFGFLTPSSRRVKTGA